MDLESDREQLRLAIVELRERLDVSKETIAAELGVSVTAVVFWLDGTRSPRPALRKKLADFAERHGAAKKLVRAIAPPPESEARA